MAKENKMRINDFSAKIAALFLGFRASESYFVIGPFFDVLGVIRALPY